MFYINCQEDSIFCESKSAQTLECYYDQRAEAISIKSLRKTILHLKEALLMKIKEKKS